MSALPPGWRWATVDEVAGSERQNLVIGPFGSNLKVSDYRPTGVPLIFVRNIRSGDFSTAATRSIDEAKATSLRAHEARSGDVLITKMGDPPGDACVYRGPPAIVTADCVRLRPSPDFDARFIAFAFASTPVSSQIEQITRGVAQRKISLSRLRTGVRLPVPSLEEQRHMVDLLEDHLSRLDAAGIMLTDTRARLWRLRQSCLETAIGGAGLDPSTRVCRIADLARVGSGATPLKSRRDYYEGGSIPWVTSGDLSQSVISHPTQYITDLACSETAVKLWPRGTLLVAMYGEGKTRGTTAELAISATTNQACAAIQLHPDFDYLRPWVKLVLEANYGSLRRLAAGGVQPNLSLGVIKSMEIPVPTLARVQSLLVNDANTKEAMSRLSGELTRVSHLSGSLRRSILQTAFTGRLTGSTGTSKIEELVGV